MNFELISEYQPTGDQPEAIAQLTEGVLVFKECQCVIIHPYIADGIC